MLAIIIPFYKLDFFNQTLLSLSIQTDKRFKVYIGNDCSPDDPKIILQKYNDSFQYEYVEFDSNLGGKSLVKQWERCIEQIKDEEWMMILGDDDTLSQNFIEEFYANLEDIEKQKNSVVRFATQVIDEKDNIISKLYQHPKLESSVDFLFRRLNGGTRSSLSEYVFKTTNVQKYNFKELPLAWHTDDLAVLEFSEFGNIFTINEALVNFRLSSKNITGKTEDRVIKNTATFDFYYYLLNNKSTFFNADQQKTLYSKLEKSFLNDKKNSYFWLKLVRIYLGSFKYKSLTSLFCKAISQGFSSKNNL